MTFVIASCVRLASSSVNYESRKAHHFPSSSHTGKSINAHCFVATLIRRKKVVWLHRIDATWNFGKAPRHVLRLLHVGGNDIDSQESSTSALAIFESNLRCHVAFLMTEDGLQGSSWQVARENRSG